MTASDRGDDIDHVRRVALTDCEWRQVLYCVRSFDFNPSDPRAANLQAKIEAQTGLKPLEDNRYKAA